MRSRSTCFVLKVLDKGTAQIDVQELATVANSQDWLLFGKGVVQDSPVGGFPAGVGRLREATIDGAVLHGFYVRRTARKNKGVQGRQDLVELGGMGQRQEDMLTASFPNGFLIVLNLRAIVFAFFLGGAPGDAHTGPESCAQLGIRSGHGT